MGTTETAPIPGDTRPHYPNYARSDPRMKDVPIWQSGMPIPTPTNTRSPSLTAWLMAGGTIFTLLAIVAYLG